MKISRGAAQQWRPAALPSHVRANSHAYISARIAVQCENVLSKAL